MIVRGALRRPSCFQLQRLEVEAPCHFIIKEFDGSA